MKFSFLFQHLKLRLGGLSLALLSGILLRAEAPGGTDPAYWETVMGRAEGIVEAIELSDADARQRVKETIAGFYVDLGRVQDSRDAAIEALKTKMEPWPKAVEEASDALKQNAQLEIQKLHRAFLGTLAADLTPDQIDQVKDGLTYGVLSVTYKAYQQFHPDLTPEEKRQIYAWLVEAREYAMDAGSSEEKHWWFGKYKGRINNYLSSRGYDLNAGR